jgi:hypothetical protein
MRESAASAGAVPSCREPELPHTEPEAQMPAPGSQSVPSVSGPSQGRHAHAPCRRVAQKRSSDTAHRCCIESLSEDVYRIATPNRRGAKQRCLAADTEAVRPCQRRNIGAVSVALRRKPMIGAARTWCTAIKTHRVSYLLTLVALGYLSRTVTWAQENTGVAAPVERIDRDLLLAGALAAIARVASSPPAFAADRKLGVHAQPSRRDYRS